MKTLNLKISNSGTYVEIMADISVDTFGTQHIPFIKEELNGTQHELFNTSNDEGNQYDYIQIMNYYNHRKG